MNLLKNNSNEMKTIVETFIIEETENLIYDNEQLDKWNKHVEELGLVGQTKIHQKTKSPIPFLHLKESMKNVLETLCPRKVNVENYDVTPIPVEILDLVSLSKNENYFTKIEIWYDDKNPDPCCIGMLSDFYVYDYNGVPVELKGEIFPNKQEALKTIKSINPSFNEKDSIGWETNIRYYLLGKWADVKHSFEELKEMATKRFILSESHNLNKQIKEAQRGLLDLEEKAFEKFN